MKGVIDILEMVLLNMQQGGEVKKISQAFYWK